MADQQISCATCGRRFPWTTGEQEYFRERGLKRPKHCRSCLAARGPRTALPPGRTRPAGTPRLATRRTTSPSRIFGVVTLVAALALSAALLLSMRSALLLAWLIGVNAVAFVTYGYDRAEPAASRRA